MKKLLLLSMIILTGCATEAKYQAYLDSLIGISKDNIVEGLGKPDEEYTANGREFLTYKTNHGNSVYVNKYGSGYSTPRYCNTTYILEKGKMVSWKYNGNTCRMD